MGMRINKKIFKRATKKLERYVKNRLPNETLLEFKSNTPFAVPPPTGTSGGNARRHTKLKKSRRGFDIVGDYDYSGVIDKGGYPKSPKGGYNKTSGGYSTQAPDGIVNPTLDFMEDQVKKFIRRNT